MLNYIGKKAHKTLNSEYVSSIMCHSFPTGKGKEVTWSLYSREIITTSNLTEISKSELLILSTLIAAGIRKRSRKPPWQHKKAESLSSTGGTHCWHFRETKCNQLPQSKAELTSMGS